MQDKIETIVKLNFSKNLKNLKTYLNLTEWLCQYMSYYTYIAESLQQYKILLARNVSFKKESHTYYFKAAILHVVIKKKNKTYQNLQAQFAQALFLIHFDNVWTFYIDIDAFKKHDFDIMLFHIKNEWVDSQTSSSQNLIESIMFFSRLLNKIEKNY